MKVAIIGAGGWGTALASILTEKHGNVNLYVRNPELAASIRQNQENKVYVISNPLSSPDPDHDSQFSIDPACPESQRNL